MASLLLSGPEDAEPQCDLLPPSEALGSGTPSPARDRCGLRTAEGALGAVTLAGTLQGAQSRPHGKPAAFSLPGSVVSYPLLEARGLGTRPACGVSVSGAGDIAGCHSRARVHAG